MSQMIFYLTKYLDVRLFNHLFFIQFKKYLAIIKICANAKSSKFIVYTLAVHKKFKHHIHVHKNCKLNFSDYQHFNCVTTSDPSPCGHDEYLWYVEASYTLWKEQTHSGFMYTPELPHLSILSPCKTLRRLFCIC